MILLLFFFLFPAALAGGFEYIATQQPQLLSYQVSPCTVQIVDSGLASFHLLSPQIRDLFDHRHLMSIAQLMLCILGYCI